MSNNNNIPKLKSMENLNKINQEHLTSEDEWVEDNIEEIMKMWNCTRSYIKDSNLTLLDKCSFSIFLNFIIKNSTHYRIYSYPEEN